MDLISAYPAILLGLVAGLVAQRRGWRIIPLLVAGAVVFTALVLHASTLPGSNASAEGSESSAPLIWAVFALVNAGSWALGVAMGVAVAETTRRADRI